VVRSRLLVLNGSIDGLTLVSDIGNIPRVSITDRVGDDLGTAIGKSHAVLSSGSNTITVLTCSKAGARVVISDSITILIDSRAIISGLMVSGNGVSGLVGGSWVNIGGLVNDGSGLVNWGRFVSGSWVVDGSGLVNGSCVVDRGRSMVSGSWVVDGSRLMVSGSWVVDRGMVDGMSKSMVNGVGRMGEGMMDKSVMNGFVGVGRDRGMGGSSVFLLVVVLVDLIGGSSGLAVDNCVVTTMGFVDGGSHSGSIAVFDALVAVLIGDGQSQEG